MIKQLKMEILSESSGVFYIKVSDEWEAAYFQFNPDTQELLFESQNELTSFLKSNEYQFRKLLHNKRKHTFHAGFNLDFSIIDGKDIAAFNNKQNILVSDHGINIEKSTILMKSKKLIGIILCGLLIFGAGDCGSTTANNNEATTLQEANSTSSASNADASTGDAVSLVTSVEGALLDTSDMFTDRDLVQSPELSEARSIEMKNGAEVVIEDEGIYVLKCRYRTPRF